MAKREYSSMKGSLSEDAHVNAPHGGGCPPNGGECYPNGRGCCHHGSGSPPNGGGGPPNGSQSHCNGTQSHCNGTQSHCNGTQGHCNGTQGQCTAEQSHTHTPSSTGNPNLSHSPYPNPNPSLNLPFSTFSTENTSTDPSTSNLFTTPMISSNRAQIQRTNADANGSNAADFRSSIVSSLTPSSTLVSEKKMSNGAPIQTHAYPQFDINGSTSMEALTDLTSLNTFPQSIPSPPCSTPLTNLSSFPRQSSNNNNNGNNNNNSGNNNMKNNSGNGNGNANTNAVVLPAFLTKTYEIFSREEYRDICSWNEAGDTIIIKRTSQFTDEILPQYFKHQNFPSFIRQLNMYGFHKSVLDSNRREFQHYYFKRGRKDLLPLIKRKANVSTSGSGHIDATLAKYDTHRESSDTFLEELRALRQRSETLEGRLRHVEMDTAVVRNENSKLWSALETSKMRQLSMQNKMKKILWFLFEVFRAHTSKTNGLALGKSKAESAALVAEEFTNSSRLADFHEILRYLDMDDPPLLGDEDSKLVQAPCACVKGDLSNTIDSITRLKKRKLAERRSLTTSVNSAEEDTQAALKVPRQFPNSGIPYFRDESYSKDGMPIQKEEKIVPAVSTSSEPITMAASSSLALPASASLFPSETNKGQSSTSTTSATSALSLFSPLISEKFLRADSVGHPSDCLPKEQQNHSSSSIKEELSVSPTPSASTLKYKVGTPENKSIVELAQSEQMRIDKINSYKNMMQKLDDYECDLLDAYDADTLDNLLVSQLSECTE